ncbi:MAG: fibronectin type III domain-containing protein [Verrucomicrobiota bacterium]
MKKTFSPFAPATLLAFVLIVATSARASTKAFSVQVSAEVQDSPPHIQLAWPGDANATGYTLSRKLKTDSAWSPLTSLPGTSTNFTDDNVNVGTGFEYKIIKSTSAGYTGYGYLFAGINLPMTDDRGKLILIVENTYAADLAAELTRLEQDLVGDGWTVIRHDVRRTDSVSSVKSLIKADYEADSANSTAVFLFGRVPVPYSGDIYPDGHTNHRGAWPADVYYGEMSGTWTDFTVTSTNAELNRTWNVPRDGKFDQSLIPGEVKLEVGRVDLANMTCYSILSPPVYEKDLLRRYLDKDHNFRHRLTTVERRGFLSDNFSSTDLDPVAGGGWRNLSGFFGASNVTEGAYGTFFPTLSQQSYLWSYGCGGGQYSYCNGVGTSDDFAKNDAKVVFTMLMGSKFGDWDTESNILRAPLGSKTYTLTCSYSGAPHSLYHHMSMGENIGYSIRLTQNNVQNGLYVTTSGTHQVHIALMGDPSLRMHPVVPPTDLVVSGNGSRVLNWAASTDENIQGYHVYRSAMPNGPFARLTGSLVTATSFVDSPAAGTFIYMVRAVKLERSGGGTYFNPSQGIFVTTPSAPALQISNLLVSEGNFGFRLTGQGCQSFAIDTSEDLSLWTPLTTNELANGEFDFSAQGDTSVLNRYYRMRPLP